MDKGFLAECLGANDEAVGSKGPQPDRGFDYPTCLGANRRKRERERISGGGARHAGTSGSAMRTTPPTGLLGLACARMAIRPAR